MASYANVWDVKLAWGTSLSNTYTVGGSYEIHDEDDL